MTPPIYVGIILILLSIAGITTVLACVDFLKPGGSRARIDREPNVPLKGVARTPPAKPRREPGATPHGLRHASRS